MNSFLRKTLSVVMLSAVALGASAQDLIAKQAPSDKRMKDVNNVRLHRSASAAAAMADLNNPAANIYSDWTHDGVSRVAGHVPANFKVDLRGFAMPTPSRKITSNFGPRWGRQHKGIDVKVYIGDTIVAAFDGKVRIVKYDGGGYGYYVVIRHPNGLETLYGHLSRQLVKQDQIVRAGQPIGLGGNTGRSTGSHLHFETRLLGQAINPAFMFDFERQDVTNDFYAVGSTPSKNVASSKSKSSKDTKDGGVMYEVKRGDTLFSIARQHGTTVDKLCKLNGIKARTVLRTGQKLKCS